MEEVALLWKCILRCQAGARDDFWHSGESLLSLGVSFLFRPLIEGEISLHNRSCYLPSASQYCKVKM